MRVYQSESCEGSPELTGLPGSVSNIECRFITQLLTPAMEPSNPKCFWAPPVTWTTFASSAVFRGPPTTNPRSGPPKCQGPTEMVAVIRSTDWMDLDSIRLAGDAIKMLILEV